LQPGQFELWSDTRDRPAQQATLVYAGGEAFARTQIGVRARFAV
jgi:hypothetical protein